MGERLITLGWGAGTRTPRHAAQPDRLVGREAGADFSAVATATIIGQSSDPLEDRAAGGVDSIIVVHIASPRLRVCRGGTPQATAAIGQNPL